MSKSFAIVSILIIMAIGFYAFMAPAARPSDEGYAIAIDGTNIRVEVADTDAERAQGLSGHAPLGADEGMLFVFPEDGFYSFWMKDMLFAIDILWLDAAGSVVHIEHALAPETYPTSFTSGSPARYVLEVRAGFATEHEIGVGSKFTDFPL